MGTIMSKPKIIGYYRLRHPVTSVRVENDKSHNSVSIFVNHARSGQIVLRSTETTSFLLAMCDLRPIMVYSFVFVGDELLGHLVEVESGLKDEMTVVGDDGDVTTVGDVRKAADRRTVDE